MSIVGVHGIWNFQPALSARAAAENLSGVWSRALGREVAVVYYAHHLNTVVAQGTDDPARLAAMEQRMLLGWVAALGAPVEIAQGRVTQPARQAADWIARRFGYDVPLVHAFVSRFCREVCTYLEGDGARRAAREAVAGVIAAHKARVVIAHSLGSVVVYEGLWAHPELEVDLLVTVGSPLGMPDVIFPRLRPEPVAGRGARPPGVARWVNIADPGDLVAVPRWLSRRFDGVDSDLECPIGIFALHKAASYLRSAAMAEVLGGIA